MLPFDDETMTYDKQEHRYILTKEYVLKKTAIDLSKVLNPAFSSEPQRLAEVFLDQLSEEIYTWIYEHNANNELQEYLLATEPILRDYIRTAMLQQVLYILKNGDLNQYSGVNLKTGQVIDQKDIVNNAIAPNAKRELNKAIGDYGYAITYQGRLWTPIDFKYREGY